MKRKYSVLAATITALLLALISTPAHASVPPDGTYLCTTGVASILTPNFTITSGVVSAGTSCAGAVVIPAGVTSIGSNAFQSATSITSITIPASVTTIGNYAFNSATSLTSVTFAPGSLLTSIGESAFNAASLLTSITIPVGVTTIGNRAFLGTTSLTSITFAAGSGLTSIGTNAFEGATALTSITIPSGVTTIGSFAFTGATSITSITIPVGVTTIGMATFFGATSLASVYFLSNAPLPVDALAFNNVAAGAKACIQTGATGFGTIGGLWNNLIVDYCLTAAGSSAASSAAPIANASRADKLATVYFSPLSSKLSKAAKKQIEAAVIANPSAVYKVTGYVQKSIFAKNESSLSLARAKAIETHLESLGAGLTFTLVIDGAGVPVKNGKSNKARRATLYAMTPVVQ